LRNAAALHFVPVARSGRKTVLLVGWLDIRNQTNGLHKVAILLYAVSFYGIGPNGK
jgi:hypothetical protein